MSSRLVKIWQRREQLVARAAFQRDQVALACRHLERPLRVVDTALSFARFLKAHPLVQALIFAGVAFALSRRISLLQLARRSFVLWRLYRAYGSPALKLRD